MREGELGSSERPRDCVKFDYVFGGELTRNVLLRMRQARYPVL